jgi:hypothetical protein
VLGSRFSSNVNSKQRQIRAVRKNDMQVSLRKAAALESALREVAKSINLSKTVSVSVYADTSERSGTVNTQIEDAQAALREGVTDIREALTAAYAIRAQIADLNAANGITALLNERAALDAVDRALSSLTTKDRSEGISPEHVSEALRAQRARNEKSDYGTTDHVSVSIVGDFAAEIKAAAAANQKRKVAIADQLLTLNVGTTLVLSDKTVEVLQKHNLV